MAFEAGVEAIRKAQLAAAVRTTCGQARIRVCSNVMPRLLYLLTGIATAIPVVWALGWAVWGAGTSPTEYLSLLGSLVLAASAAIGARRVAARMALVGAMAVWSFYLPAIVGVARIRLSDQELNFSVLLWTPSDSPLQIDEPKQVPNFPDMRLSTAAIRQIKVRVSEERSRLIPPMASTDTGRKVE